MRKSVKEYLAAFGKWGFVVAALLVGDVLGVVQSYDTFLRLQSWAWWLILVAILAVSPLIAFHKLRLKRDELYNQLSQIKNARPNIELLGIENFQATLQCADGFVLGTPIFTRVNFANNPLGSLQAVDAPNITGHIDFFTEDQKSVLNIIGRWSETREEMRGARAPEMEQITMAPNGRPNPLDIVLKYHEDLECYGHTSRGRQSAPDWRDSQSQLSLGIYLVRVHLRGINVDTQFWFSLVNRGSGTDIEMHRLPNGPLVPGKVGSQP